MKIINVLQGTKEWHEFRANHLNASDAPAMMGVSPYKSRTELIHEKHTGIAPDVDDATQARFDGGHAAEASARPLAEEIIGQDLFPITVADDEDRLGASLDGITMGEDIIWEHKSLNKAKAALVDSGECPESDYPQVQQQLMITGAEKCLYMISDGTKDNMHHCWVKPDLALQKMLVKGWEQFEKDLADYQPTEAEPEVMGRAPEELPALFAEVQGKVISTNLAEFKNQALNIFQSINKDLATDEDFANAEKTVKWCEGVETKLEATKEHVLGQTASIDELFRTIDEIKDEARRTRLDLNKLVQSRKKSIRDEILFEAKSKLADHIDQINATLGGKIKIPDVKADFPGVMKNKRTISSLRNAVDTELARAKLEANEVADKIRLNLDTLRSEAEGFAGLFPDAQQLVLKENDDLSNLIKLRISEHKQAEQKRLDEERERIRQEEQAKAEAAAREEQARIAEQHKAEQARAEAEETARMERAAEAEVDGITEADQPAPAEAQQPGSAPAPIKPAVSAHRPSDDQIIEVLALHYRVHESKIIEWLLDMDLHQASDKLAQSM